MIRLHQPRSAARRGSAMIAGIFVVLVVSILSMSYLQLSLSRNRENNGSVDAKRAFFMAEAGIAEGYAALVAGKSGVVASPEEPAVYGNGVFWVEATALSPTRVQLHATGLSGTGRDSLTVVVERTTRTLADYGIFGDDEIRVGLGAAIETYDSRVADEDNAGIGIIVKTVDGLIYGDGTSRLRVGSNGDITFIGGRVGFGNEIDGDVIPGPGHSVVIGPGVTITGSTAPAENSVIVDTVDVPQARPAGAFSHIRPDTYDHDPALVKYDSMSISAGRVVLHGPMKLVTGDLTLSSGATLDFDTTNGPIRMYVQGRVDLDEGSFLDSQHDDPTQLMIVLGAVDTDNGDGSWDRKIRIESSGEFHGFVYSPGAQVRINPTLAYHGSVVAKRLVIEPGATLNFDEALLDILPDGSQIDSDLISWRFVELPEAEIVETKIDPLTWMKIRGKQLRKPSEMHDDDWDGTVDAGDILTNRLKETVVN